MRSFFHFDIGVYAVQRNGRQVVCFIAVTHNIEVVKVIVMPKIRMPTIPIYGWREGRIRYFGIYVVNSDNTVEYRHIETGTTVDDTLRLVRSGIAPGERYVRKALLKVHNGMRITPVGE